MRVGLISDTHGKLRNEVLDVFTGVGVILHAGDVGSPSILTDLETIAPVHAVYGNTDGFEVRRICKGKVDLALAGKRLIVTHGDELGSPAPHQLRLQHPGADVIVYGHTHIPLFEAGPPVVVNPGAAGPARFKVKPSVAILELPSLRVTFFDL